jgi:hypothetical protein
MVQSNVCAITLRLYTHPRVHVFQAQPFVNPILLNCFRLDRLVNRNMTQLGARGAQLTMSE